MAKEFSPEEKLLNLIKRKKKIGPDEDIKNIPIPRDAESPLKQKGALTSTLSDLQNIIRVEHIKILNIFLFIALILIIIYLFIDIFFIGVGEIPRLEEEPARRPVRVIEEIEIKPYSYFSKDLKGKEIFKPLVEQEAPKLRSEAPAEELIGNLALLGIVSGENPQAIIEDKKQNKTFFLREGQSAGEVFLKRIEDGTVTVIYKGEEFNLTM